MSKLISIKKKIFMKKEIKDKNLKAEFIKLFTNQIKLNNDFSLFSDLRLLSYM